MGNLSEKSLKQLNSKKGIKYFLNDNTMTPLKAVRIMNYENKLKKLQGELIKLQKWVEDNDEKVVIIFEGRDAAGKGGAIRRITQHLNPREFKVVALPKPTEEELEEITSNVIAKNFSHRVLIIDELHNLREENESKREKDKKFRTKFYYFHLNYCCSSSHKDF